MEITKEVSIKSETDLHYKIIEYIRLYFSNIIIVPGLGEHQFNTKIRTDAYMKGYKSGAPDILILNQHHIYNGLAIELNPYEQRHIITKPKELFRRTKNE